MEIKNAVIVDADIGKLQFTGKGQVIIAKITFDTGDSLDQAVTVQLPDDCIGQWLRKFFDAVGIDSLWQAGGKAVRLRIGATSEGSIRIGHIIRDVWFNPYDSGEDSAA